MNCIQRGLGQIFCTFKQAIMIAYKIKSRDILSCNTDFDRIEEMHRYRYSIEDVSSSII